jgi:hypothetical protein
MQIIVYNNDKQEKVDPKFVKVNNISLDQWFAKVNQLEKRIADLENLLNKQADFAKAFKERRL